MIWQYRPVQWWRDAVVYEIEAGGFADSDGDGIGDLNGVRSRLGYLELLGVDAVCLTPLLTRPDAAPGDGAEPCSIDPALGDLAGFDALVADAHACALRVVVGFAPHHTGLAHPWFRAALDGAPGGPERDRYHFRSGGGPTGGLPPNNWRSLVGGPAWSRVGAQWYLHLFGAGAPDLNWTNPEVWADLEKTLRFWGDRGVDGFLLESAHAMSKPARLPPARPGFDPRLDDDGAHGVHRMIRAVLDHYPGRLVAGEIGVGTVADRRLARYLRPDELHLVRHPRLGDAGFDAAALRIATDRVLAATAEVDAVPAWALTDHRGPRPVSRYGGGATGRARARAMALVTLALPGTVFLTAGEELGLPDAPGGPPMPWDDDACGVGARATPEGTALSAARQLEDTGSTLSLHRRALELRRSLPGLQAGGPGVEWFGAPSGCLAFRRTGATLVCALNASDAPVPLPPGSPVVASGPLGDGLLPPDTAVWLD